MGAVSLAAGGENGEGGGLLWSLRGGGVECLRLLALQTLGSCPGGGVGFTVKSSVLSSPSSSSSSSSSLPAKEMMVATAGSSLSAIVEELAVSSPAASLGSLMFNCGALC